MDFVIYETALRLKDAGFPQPEFGTKQMWYNKSGALLRPVTHTSTWEGQFFLMDENGELEMVDENWSTWTDPDPVYDPRSLCFAPTATDILRETPDLSLNFHFGQWVVFHTDTGNYESEFHDNPAEACAAAWLAIHEKK